MSYINVYYILYTHKWLYSNIIILNSCIYILNTLKSDLIVMTNS